MNYEQAECSLTTPRSSATQPQIVTARTVMNDTIISNKAEQDGLSHINIDQRGRTVLGRALSHMHRLNFVHPEFGPFQSIEGMIGFIRSGAKVDEFHYVWGMNARYRSKKLDTMFIRGFREIVMEANYFKVMQNEELREALVKSTLKFDHYYLFGNGRPIQPKNASWIIPGFEELRTLIKAGEKYPAVDYSGVLELDQE